MPFKVQNTDQGKSAPLVAQPAKPAADATPPPPNPFAAALDGLEGFLRSVIALLAGSLRFANTCKTGDGRKLTIGGAGHLLEFSCLNLSASTRYLMLFDSRSPQDGDTPKRVWTITTLQTFDAVWPHGRPFNTDLCLIMSSQLTSLQVVTAKDASIEATFRT